ncbi:MAG: tetratricopeptide repeat protein [Pyrinomonadaceae bacterium]|nr:tetratricopeptide repeat protein [Pyrinomonadaceae bacterium]
MIKYLKSCRFGLLLACLLITPAYLFGQDLGSSNGLFRSSKSAKKASTKKKTTKKASSKKKRIAKKSTTRKKSKSGKRKSQRVASRKSKKRSGRSNTPKKKVDISKSKSTQTLAKRNVKPDIGGNTVITYGKAKGGSFSEVFEKAIEEGNEARNRRDYLAAEKAYNRARATNPLDSRAIYGLGNIFSDQQRWEEAEKAYRHAIELEPNSPEPYIAISYVLTQPVVGSILSERYAEAEKMARQAIVLSPNNAIAFDQLGVAMELRGLISQPTINVYRKAIELEPTFALAYAHLGRILRRNGLTKESSEAYRKAIELSTDGPTMILVADVMQSQQRYIESEQLLRKALRQDPKNPTALFLLGRALTTRKSFSEAEAVLKKSVEVSPGSFVSYALLGSLYTRFGRLPQAEQTLNQALRVVSENEKRRLAQEFEEVADGYVKQQRLAAAIRVYRQALKLDKTNKAVIAKLAKAKTG